MPGQTHKIYGNLSSKMYESYFVPDDEDYEPYQGFFDLTEDGEAGAVPAKTPRYVRSPEKKAQDDAKLEKMRNDANARMQARFEQGRQLRSQGKHYEAGAMMNPMEYMRRGFHRAFGVDPATGKKVVHEDEKTRMQKYLDARKVFENHLRQHGGIKGLKKQRMFGENHKTRTSTGVGYKTIGLSLTPGKHSGYKDPHGRDFDLCPLASEECREGCLGLKSGGNRQYPVLSMQSKLLRTHFIYEHPEEAARIMHQEMLENEQEAAKTQVQKPRMGPDGKPMIKPVMTKARKNKTTGEVIHPRQKMTKAGKPMTEDDTEPVFDKDGKPMYYRSGIRLNVTSDLPYEHYMPREFFDSHKPKENPAEGEPQGSEIYDYTKMHGRFNHKDMPGNYHLALSHTGTNHPESNDREVIKHLENGGVVASVYKRGLDPKTKKPRPEAKWYMDDATGKMYPVANGDNDDNVFDRHASLGVPKTQGVISALELKGINNEDAGHFANEVDENGIVHLNSQQAPRIAQRGKNLVPTIAAVGTPQSPGDLESARRNLSTS
jgi:hypothetical protein